MLSENLLVASSSERTDVAEGVVDAMFRALSSRQRMWQSLIDAELVKYASPNADSEGLQALQDFLISVANDQINCIDEEDDRPSYVTVFARDVSPLVSESYTTKLNTQIATLQEGYLELGINGVKAFVNLIFLVDFRPILSEFFTSAWYSQKRISAITSTFADYLSDYSNVLHPSLQVVLIEELSDELLAAYLSAVRNKGAKFRRADPFAEKIRDDVLTVWKFFEPYESYPDIKSKWRAVSELVKLLETEKSQVPFVYEEIKMAYWDVQISWVEAALRARDDFERSMLNAVKAKAAEINTQIGDETIMSKVK